MPEQHSSFKAVFHRHDVQLAGIIVAMAVIFSALSRNFLTASNLVSLLENYSVIAIMAAGL
jgi:simple sugar transport system permease protein